MKKILFLLTLPLVLISLIALSNGIVYAKQFEVPPLDPINFDSPRDNIYLPMAIGQTYVYSAETEDGLVRNEITHTSDVKTILGVNCTVVHDIEWVFVEGKGMVLTEETFDWLAWDNQGHVWYFGEDTTEHLYDENWNPIGTSKEGSWEAGLDGAEPGILMLADPRLGLSYRQEFYEDVAEDMAKVLRLNASVSVAYGDFDGCLKTKEWTPLDPGVIEQKFYAPNVGLVFIKELKGKTVMVELVDIY
jgi:hypothetical protein